MFSFWGFVGLSILSVIVFLVFGNAKLKKRVKSWINRKQDGAADSFGNEITDYSDNLAEARNQAVEFKKKIADLMAEVRVNKNTHGGLVADAEKWNSVASQAAAGGNTEHVKRALAEKQKSERRALSLLEQVEKNSTLVENLRAKLNAREDQIDDAESNTAALKARNAGNEMRRQMHESSAAFGGSDSLGNLNVLTDKIARDEALVDSMDELAGQPVSDLENLYSVNTALDDEVAKMMASVKKEEKSVISD